jgi:hypothetical protein
VLYLDMAPFTAPGQPRNEITSWRCIRIGDLGSPIMIFPGSHSPLQAAPARLFVAATQHRQWTDRWIPNC